MTSFANNESFPSVVDELEHMWKANGIFQSDFESLHPSRAFATVENGPNRSETAIVVKVIALQFEIRETP